MIRQPATAYAGIVPVIASLLAATVCAAGETATAGTLATLGGGVHRNMVSPATGLPTRWDPSGTNVRWVAELGSEAYASPVVAGGRVFIGTNNGKPRDPARSGDLGVLMAFDQQDGRFLWQVTHDKLAGGRINDWPLQGVCTTPTVEGDRLYYTSNRGELRCLDVADGRAIWSLDMIATLGVHPHHMTVSSPLIVGDRLFVHTSHGVDEAGKVPDPRAPSFLAVDKKSGEVLWRSAAPGAGIVDGQWSSPSYARVGGREQVLFPGGDGWLYAFAPASGEALWRFDASRHLSAGVPRENLIAPAVVHGGRVYIAVGHDPELGGGVGRLWALDATGSGDVTADAVVWSYAAEAFSRTLGAVAIADGLLYVADLNGFLHCLELETGKPLWRHDTFAAVWAPPLVADGKVFVVDEDGDVAVLAAGRTEKLLFEVNMGNAIYAAPAAVDGTLLVATRSRLFALGGG